MCFILVEDVSFVKIGFKSTKLGFRHGPQMIFFLAIVLIAILVFSSQADGNSISKEDIQVAVVVVVGTLLLLGLGKALQAWL